MSDANDYSSPADELHRLAATPGWEVDEKSGNAYAAWMSPEGTRWTISLTRSGPDKILVMLLLGDNAVDYHPNLKVHQAVAQAQLWLANLRAGWTWNSRPRPMKNFFTDKAWQPPGARLHVLLLPDLDVIRSWHRRYADPLRAHRTLRVVPAEHLHITLAWLRSPLASAVTDDQRTALIADLRDRYRALAWPKVANARPIEPAVGTYEVKCSIDWEDNNAHTAGLGGTAAAMTAAALRAVFGADADATHSYQHMTLAYSHAELADSRPLRDAIGRANPVAEGDLCPLGPGAHIVVVDADTFNADLWAWSSSQTVWPPPDQPDS